MCKIKLYPIEGYGLNAFNLKWKKWKEELGASDNLCSFLNEDVIPANSPFEAEDVFNKGDVVLYIPSDLLYEIWKKHKIGDLRTEEDYKNYFWKFLKKHVENTEEEVKKEIYYIEEEGYYYEI